MAGYSIWCTIDQVMPGLHAALIVVAPADRSIEEHETPDHEVSFHATHAAAVEWCARRTIALDERVAGRGDTIVRKQMVG